MICGIFFICVLTCFLNFVAEKRLICQTGKIYCFFISVFVSFGLLILMTANRIGYDVRNYRAFYEYVSLNHRNPWDYSYTFYCKMTMLFHSLFQERSYFEFQAIILLALGCILVTFISRYSFSYCSVLFLYLLSGVFASDGMQFKNFIAVCFLVPALSFLQKGQGRKGLFIYLILVGMACLFHFSFIVYLLLPLVKFKVFERIKIIFPVVGVAAYIMFLLGGTELISFFLQIVSKFPGLGKLSGYAGGFAGVRSLVPVMLYFMGLFGLYLSFCDRKNLPDKQAEYFKVIWNIWIFMGVFLPILAFANASYRLYRNLYIPIFMVLSNYIVSLPRLSQKRSVSSVLVIGYVITIFLYPVALGQAEDIYGGLIQGELFWR